MPKILEALSENGSNGKKNFVNLCLAAERKGYPITLSLALRLHELSDDPAFAAIDRWVARGMGFWFEYDLALLAPNCRWRICTLQTLVEEGRESPLLLPKDGL